MGCSGMLSENMVNDKMSDGRECRIGWREEMDENEEPADELTSRFLGTR